MSQSFQHLNLSRYLGEAGATGNGSWADFPYYGSEKFWFIEDNTVLATGNDISGTIDPSTVADGLSGITFSINAHPVVMAQKAVGVRGERCEQIYNNTFHWTREP